MIFSKAFQYQKPQETEKRVFVFTRVVIPVLPAQITRLSKITRMISICLLSYNKKAMDSMDPVMAATLMQFRFVLTKLVIISAIALQISCS